MGEVTKHYSNGEVTIVWKNTLCIHSAKCFHGLPEVFHPLNLPWITPEKASTEQIIEQVKKCPSGALNYFMNDVNQPVILNEAKRNEESRDGT